MKTALRVSRSRLLAHVMIAPAPSASSSTRARRSAWCPAWNGCAVRSSRSSTTTPWWCSTLSQWSSWWPPSRSGRACSPRTSCRAGCAGFRMTGGATRAGPRHGGAGRRARDLDHRHRRSLPAGALRDRQPVELPGPRPAGRAGLRHDTAGGAGHDGAPADPAGRRLRAGRAGRGRTGGRGRAPGGRRRSGAPAAVRADQDRGGAPEPRQPGRGVRRPAARRADLLPQAGLGAGRPRRRRGPARRVPVPELRGRGRHRDRPLVPGHHPGAGRGLHRGLHDRERLRPARLP